MSRRRPIPFQSRSAAIPQARTPSSTTSYDNLSYSDFSESFGLGQVQDDVAINHDEHLFLSERITTKWRQLLEQLFSGNDCNHDVKNIIEQLEDEKDHKQLPIQDVASRALQEWTRRKGSQAKFSHLLRALEKIGRTDLKEKLVKRRLETSFRGHALDTSGQSSISSFNSISYPSIHGADSHNSFYCVDYNSSFYAFGDGHIPDLLHDPFDEADDDYINIVPRPSKVPNEQRLPEIDKLKSCLNNPSLNLISLAGPIISGKTTILDIVHREIETGIETGFERTKVIKIQNSAQKDVNWLTSKIVEIISKQIQVSKDQNKQAINALKGIIETDVYEDIVLILDVSLIPYSDIGKGITNFLHKLMLIDELSSKITVVISTLWSLEDSKVFRKIRGRACEIIVQAMSYEKSFKFLTEVNNKFSKHVASKICTKIECFPFLLKYIAEMDLEKFFCVNGKYELLRALDCQFDLVIEDICKNIESKGLMQILFDCFDMEQKQLLAQLLTFSSEFDVKRLTRIASSGKRIFNSALNIFCENGALILKSTKAKDDKNVLYRIPAVTGNLMKKIVMNDKDLYEKFLQAEQHHQQLYLDLLSYMSCCLMGDKPSKNQELQILGPFSARDGVSENLSVAISDFEERPKRIIRLFSLHRNDIKQCLQAFNSTKPTFTYNRAVDSATDLCIFYLLLKLLNFHEIHDLYQGLTLISEQHNHLDTEKLRIFLAAIQIYSFDCKFYSSEARSLLDAAHDPLCAAMKGEQLKQSARDSYMLCLFSQVLSLLSQKISKIQDFKEDLCCSKFRSIYLEVLPEQSQTVSYEAFLVYNLQRLAVYHLHMGNVAEAIDIVDNECLPFCLKYLGNQHPIALDCKKIKSMVYLTQKNYKLARKSLLEISDAEEELFGECGTSSLTVKLLGLCNLEMFKVELQRQSKFQNLQSDTGNLIGNTGNAEQTFVQKRTYQTTDQRSSFGFTVSIKTEITEDNEDHYLIKQVHKSEADKIDSGSSKLESGADAVCYCDSNYSDNSDQTLTSHTSDKEGSASDINRFSVQELISIEMGRNANSVGISNDMKSALADLEKETKKYLKKAASQYAYTMGQCSDAYECMMSLSEFYKLLGLDNKSEKWLEKAKAHNNVQ